MRTRQVRDLPTPLKAVRQRFERWRRTHRPRSRIPDALWAAAVKMADRYGLCRAARALPVEYYLLKKHVEQDGRTSSERHASAPLATFVELPSPVPTGECDCTLELEDTDGAKMRIHLKAATPPDLAALCRSFRSPAP
jgi:hypothetical protein